MSDTYGVLDRLVDALARGDREAALECFAPGATVVVSGIPPRLRLVRADDRGRRTAPVVHGDLVDARRCAGWSAAPGSRRASSQPRTSARSSGSDPTGERVVANLRISSSLAPDGRLETLSVWGSREAVMGQLGVLVGAAGIADTLVATARERLSTGVREYTPEEIAAFPVPPPPPRDGSDPVRSPHRAGPSSRPSPSGTARIARSPCGVSRRSPCSASSSASSR